MGVFKHLFYLLAAFGVSLAAHAKEQSPPTHGIAMHGTLHYKQDFPHFSYVFPNAPKGGKLRLVRLGTFDSLNPFIIKGLPLPDVRLLVFESLMARSQDEAFSLYGLLAQSIQVDESRRWIVFKLRDNARFSDGHRVTVEDVIFSYKALKNKGRPNHRFYYGQVASVEKLDAQRVKFTFKPQSGREMPLIMGLMPILPRHVYQGDLLTSTFLTPPVGSGPYKVTKVDAGRRVVFERRKNYWGQNLNVTKGRYNANQIVLDYYKDATSAFEAFKAGLYDLWLETNPGRFMRGYDFEAVRLGQIVRETLPLQTPSGMWGFVFNTRRKVFSDILVRKALFLALNGAWINKNLYFNQYHRTQSYFDRSVLSSANRAMNAMEKDLLAPFSATLPAAIRAGQLFGKNSAVHGAPRARRRQAEQYLRAAGLTLKNGLWHGVNGTQVLRFTILTKTAEEEKLALVYKGSLAKWGIVAQVRRVDASQYQKRLQDYDFDMILTTWHLSLSPGNEQRFYWGSQSATVPGTRNYMGVRSKGVDGVIQHLLKAKKQTSFVSAVRALDRLLLSGYYVVPLFHQQGQWIARRKHLKRPAKTPVYGMQLDTWWLQTPDD